MTSNPTGGEGNDNDVEQAWKTLIGDAPYFLKTSFDELNHSYMLGDLLKVSKVEIPEELYAQSGGVFSFSFEYRTRDLTPTPRTNFLAFLGSNSGSAWLALGIERKNRWKSTYGNGFRYLSFEAFALFAFLKNSPTPWGRIRKTMHGWGLDYVRNSRFYEVIDYESPKELVRHRILEI